MEFEVACVAVDRSRTNFYTLQLTGECRVDHDSYPEAAEYAKAEAAKGRATSVWRSTKFLLERYEPKSHS